MIQISAELLALTSEPALLVRGGRLLFANDAACALLGPDCLDKSFSALFGEEIAGMQAPAFVGEAEVAGRRFLLRIRALEGVRAVFLSPCETMGELISDSFLYTLRSELMQLSVGTQRLRASVAAEDAQGLAALRVMLQSLYRLNRTLQNLSVIRGAEQGTIFFHPQPLELCSLLSDLLDSVCLSVQSPEISFCAPESLPVRGDPELLEQLVLNLLSNCLRHAEGCTRIRVSLHGTGDQVILSVDDDGRGIPGDRLHTVLERYRYGGGLSDADNGPGLGLTAAREIARLHGGTLLLESREGVGTAVRVSLSRAAVPHGVLRSPLSDYGKSYDSILTGLASCLPPEAFDVPDRM
ncbi:MAG: sensor histidine kinase [Oscillospiraceae bacterium]|nr:sensor histidine kinase [Oscillospiraceae bacterium]